MNTLEVLTKLEELFSSPDTWTKETLIDKHGKTDCYCIVGGIVKVLGYSNYTIGCYTLDYFRTFPEVKAAASALNFKKIGENSSTSQMVIWNDKSNTTYPMLINRIKKAKARLARKK
jgi:hypothetical protein